MKIWKILVTSKFQVPFPRWPYIRSLAAFSCLFCLKLHDFTTIETKHFVGGGPHPPPHPICDSTNTFYNAKTIVSKCVWVVRLHRGRSYLWKGYCLESCFQKIFGRLKELGQFYNTNLPYIHNEDAVAAF